MRFKQLLTKSLLVAAGLCVGANSAWAYEIPYGMEVKDVLIGTLSAGDVAAETFDEDGATVPSFTNSAGFTISDAIPTDQWQSCATSLSGKVLQLGSRSTHEIDFPSVVTSGKIVFSADFYVGINQKIIKFIDNDNQIVARFVFPDKNASNGRVYGQQYLYVDVDNEAVFSSTPKINDTYQGTRNREYRITELVIDLDANKITYSGKVMDRRNSSDKWCDDNATITLSKSISIKGMIIDASGVGNNTYYAYYDNMKLYSVDLVAGFYNYTIKATANNGALELKTLAESTCEKGSDYSITGLPYVIEKDGKFYVLEDAQVSNFGATFTMGDADEVKNINYTLDESITNFYEAESIVNKAERVANDGECSGGKRINYWPNNTVRQFTIAQKGVYTVETNVNSARTGHPLYFYEGGTSEGAKLVTMAGTAGVSTYNFVVASDNMSIGIGCSGGSNASAFDYFLIRKLYDVTGTVIGATDCSTAWKDATTSPVTLKPGDSYRYQFVNYNNGANINDQNWQLIVANADNSADVLEIRADWYENLHGSTVAEHQRGFTSDGNWWDIVPSKMNGATVDMTVTFTTDKKFVMTSTTTGSDGTTTRTYNYTSDNGNSIDLTANDALTVYLTVANNWLDITAENQTAVGITPANANSTYCSAYDLDFSGVDGLKAYIAASGKVDKSITLSSVDQIKAEEGMVLVGTAGTTYSVPVTTVEEAPATNYMEGVTVDTDMTGKNVYILGTDGLFHPCSSGTLAAGKAYLNISSSGAKSLNIMFDNETLGINDATLLNKNAEGMGEKTIYNLSGQRIAAPQKGINIIGGRKVVVK